MVSALVKVGGVVVSDPYLSAAVCIAAVVDVVSWLTEVSVDNAVVVTFGRVVVESLAVLLREQPAVSKLKAQRRPPNFVRWVLPFAIFTSLPLEELPVTERC
ncbi:MAG: hypothetical protein VYB56_05770 [Actinomycetota bacterium]|nr:hypothetical protein [Actinomycetota bacterium]